MTKNIGHKIWLIILIGILSDTGYPFFTLHSSLTFNPGKSFIIPAQKDKIQPFLEGIVVFTCICISFVFLL